MLRWIIFSGIVLIVDLYAYQILRTLTRVKYIHLGYWLLSLAVLINFIYKISTFDGSRGLSSALMLSFGLLVLSFVPKLIGALVLLLEDLVRIIQWISKFFARDNQVHFPERRAFLSKAALGIAALPFVSILYGLTKGKYNYQVIRHTLEFDDLPASFDGMKITHISDIHCGSFDNPDKIAYGIDLINEQKSDVILFTGDIVNNRAEEMDAWVSYFKRLEAREGKYSILGNHDYAEYIRGIDKEERARCFQKIKDIHPKIGFNLMLNEHVFIERNGERIVLMGVENWGTRFKKAGDLVKASSGVDKEDFKVLMSHDPSHWEAEVRDHDLHVHLTLSGHTHGMQFGIEIPGIKWSPVKYVYKYWAGMYEALGQYLNVNRGFGFLAFPGRVGIWPEITVITLKRT